MSELLKMGGLWKNKDKNGNEYFSGDFTFGTKILIYKNGYKSSEKEPDYQVYLAPKKKVTKEEGGDIPF